MKARCNGCSLPPCAKPSTVRIFLPCACTANIRQERTASWPMMTVQTPHTPCSQPMWVPVNPQSSRIASTSVLRGSTWMSWPRPLMVRVMLIFSVIERWQSLRQLVAELGSHQGLDLLAGPHHDRERVSPAERPAGVDDDAGVARVLVRI